MNRGRRDWDVICGPSLYSCSSTFHPPAHSFETSSSFLSSLVLVNICGKYTRSANGACIWLPVISDSSEGYERENGENCRSWSLAEHEELMNNRQKQQARHSLGRCRIYIPLSSALVFRDHQRKRGKTVRITVDFQNPGWNNRGQKCHLFSDWKMSCKWAEPALGA